ncbi:MAG: ShlB/FhaC/HecB family hemolysin secretion/activation protein, partial [Reinekea sp.]
MVVFGDPKGACARRFLFLSLFSVSAIFSTATQAETADEAAQKQNDQIIQLQQQQNSAQQQEIEQQRQHLSIDAGTLTPSKALPDSDQCFMINSVEVIGVTTFSAKNIDKLTQPYRAKCLSLKEINELLQKLTHRYFDKGYVTTRAYLPQQSLASGVLQIQVIEGTVEQFDKTQAKGINILTAFPGILNDQLNLRDIEQGIEQLNRLGRNQVSMELLPGSEAGNTIIQLTNNKSRFWQANIRFDNSGQPSTGEYQARAYLSLDRPLWLNDFFYVSYQMDTVGDSGKDSRSTSVHWDVPYGYWLLSTDASWFNYTSRVKGDAQSFDTSGDSQSQTVKLSRILARNATAKTEAITSLTRKENHNFIEDVKLDTSSRTLSVANFQIRQQKFLPGGQSLQGSLGYKRGVPVFGSVKRKSKDAPNPEYGAWLADVDYGTGFQWLNQRWSYSTSLAAQYSDENLLGSEQFSIGSLYSVRGFNGEGLSANSGVYLRNDLAVTLPIKFKPLGLRTLKPSVGLDAGAVFNATHYKNWLGGMATGLSFGAKYFSADLIYTRALA